MAGLTQAEIEIVDALADIWNRHAALPKEHSADDHEFMHHIHAAQEKILARAGRRQLYDRARGQSDGN